MADPVRIKPEPDVGSPGVEDELDESTDLEFYNKAIPGDPYSRMYLARLPGYLWQAWADLGDDDEIEIGKVRQWKDPSGGMKVQMLLNPKLPQHQELPREYNMDIVNPNVNNTFVFTEQDLPSFAAKNKERAAALAQGIPAHLLRQQQQKQQPDASKQGERGRRSAPYTRRAIPKKTTISGTIKHEVVCTPVQNAETDFLMANRALVQQAPKQEINVEGQVRTTQAGGADWEKFIKTQDTKITKAKKMENKTARWPENQLLDEIARCFSEHKYWSIKAFRNRIPQPEAFIRECLEKVAVLHRSGPFANNWELKPEYREGIMGKDLPEPANTAAAPKPTVDIESDDEDDDLQMEDVGF